MFSACYLPAGWQLLASLARPFLVAGMAKRGKPADEIERVLQIETVPEAATTPNPAGKNQHSKPKEVSPHDEGQPIPHAKAERLRAVTRAPDVVKDAGSGGALASFGAFQRRERSGAGYGLLSSKPRLSPCTHVRKITTEVVTL
ncbi:MAG: hypothetical protein SFV15_16780 [Polyangiaceae bacterium]|nr:hypothetical protein [Polyangiaceae bacterium]